MNPFAQAVAYTEMHCELSKDEAAQADLYFEDCAVSVSTFELDEARARWKLVVLFDATPDAEDIRRRLSLFTRCTEFALEPRAPQDWVVSVAQDFPPLTIGRFFVHGSHVTDGFPASAIALHVDAGAAFGSGEHATTSGCLQALQWVHQHRRPSRVLDVGTGSGILAIAAAKLFRRAEVSASDLDIISVRVAKENTHLNGVQHVNVFASNGYLSPQIQGTYDVILANILARPLCAMAKHAAKHLAADGVLILSGLLVEQETMVLQAHRVQGLRLVKRLRINGWSTLVLGGGR